MTFLKWEDYVVLTIAVILSLGVGLFQSLRKRNMNTTKTFIMGDSKMSFLPVAISLMVSYESGIMMLGIPAEVYIYGMQWGISYFGFFIADMTCRQVFAPAIRKLEITSIYEYLELRFKSHGIRIFATVLGMFYGINYFGTVLFLPAISLEAVGGIPTWISIVVLQVVVLVYTLIGGFKAVIWSDVIQTMVMLIGILAVLIKGTIAAGGVTATWSAVYDTGRVNLFEFNPDPTLRQSFWSLLIGSSIRGFSTVFMQTTFLRIKATPTLQSTSNMYLVTAFSLMMMSWLGVLEGAVMFGYYYNQGCDPLESKQLDNQNQLMPAMVVDLFHDTPCMPGLFFAALFSASLSSMSSLLSSMSAMFWEDIVKPHTKPMSERRGIIITQISMFMFGVLGCSVAFVVSELEGPVTRIFNVMSSSVTGAMTGVFLLAFLVPWANSLGAIVGGLSSVLFVGWISVGKFVSTGVRVHPKLEPAPMYNCPSSNISIQMNSTNFDSISSSLYLTNITASSVETESLPQGLDALYSLSYMWLGALGVLIVVLVGALVSRLKDQPPVDPDLLIPVFDLVCCCLPKWARKRCRCLPELDTDLNEEEKPFNEIRTKEQSV
ncbi:sodium-dependent multivitamin transporter-like [Ylistrum balloti]|uniref:sodium-dependent multivitamin transporter-like n=1 Tax=Ylistrum balloti TaxID=509963 RepID=UPI002905B76D|nr:sodium-dependent multivitamin transporter-like [Ylistrum balloti]